jgi:hypothetical protein
MRKLLSSKSQLCYGWRSVGQSALVSDIHLRPMISYKSPSDICRVCSLKCYFPIIGLFEQFSVAMDISSTGSFT